MKRVMPVWVGWPRLDWPLFFALLLLMGFGLLVLYSASGEDSAVIMRQAVRMGAGIAVMLMLSLVPPHLLRLWTPWIFGAGVILLLLTWFMGVGRGAGRWLDLGFIRFQPAEIMKLAVPMMIAWYFHPLALPPSIKATVIAFALLAIPDRRPAGRRRTGSLVLHA